MLAWKKDILIRVIDLENQCIEYEDEIFNLKKKVDALEKPSKSVKKTSAKSATVKKTKK